MDAPDPEKSLRYWQNLAMDDLVRAQTPQQRKKKIKSCIKLIYDTGTQLERLGSECVVAVGSAAYGIYVKVWGFGKSADKCLDDFNNNGVSLKRALESRAQIDLLASNAATLLKTSPETQNIADTNTNTEPLTQKALPLEELIRRDKRNEVKQMLVLIPNLSTTPIFGSKGNFTKRFWYTHEIENWPPHLPTLLQKSLSDWTTKQCIEVLRLYQLEGSHTWSIVATGKIFGAMGHQEIPKESLEPLYLDDFNMTFEKESDDEIQVDREEVHHETEKICTER